MSQSQKQDTKEPETNSSVLQQEGQADTTRGDAIAHYNLDINYDQEGSHPDIKAVNEEEENYEAKYVKMELP